MNKVHDWSRLVTENVETVNHPKHYTECSLECIQAMHIAFGTRATLDFCLVSAFKYMWRYKHKRGAEDLKKALWYVSYVDDFIRLDESFCDLGSVIDCNAVVNKCREMKSVLLKLKGEFAENA